VNHIPDPLLLKKSKIRLSKSLKHKPSMRIYNYCVSECCLWSAICSKRCIHKPRVPYLVRKLRMQEEARKRATYKQTPWPLVRKRTIPTERPPTCKIQWFQIQCYKTRSVPASGRSGEEPNCTWDHHRLSRWSGALCNRHK
jgi:hypothetical protein